MRVRMGSRGSGQMHCSAAQVSSWHTSVGEGEGRRQGMEKNYGVGPTHQVPPPINPIPSTKKKGMDSSLEPNKRRDVAIPKIRGETIPSLYYLQTKHKLTSVFQYIRNCLSKSIVLFKSLLIYSKYFSPLKLILIIWNILIDRDNRTRLKYLLLIWSFFQSFNSHTFILKVDNRDMEQLSGMSTKKAICCTIFFKMLFVEYNAPSPLLSSLVCVCENRNYADLLNTTSSSKKIHLILCFMLITVEPPIH